ncbi:acyltransferase family protein [Pseudoduganella sp. GCM10020061]|uniref:acyltransferase family protein n=1 Tax=Pseudoduganella sp. GCM10020061 TaxID=3317345 RepID=UPI003635F85B
MLHGRLISLDAFRGFTIAAMVLVNNPGDWNHLYGPLAHAPWNGWTFTDLIFPFFLFIAGVSMALSLGRQLDAGAPKGALVAKLAQRALLIFLIGLALNFIPAFNLDTLRIPGVLQRIALCTLLAAPIAVYLGWRGQLATVAALLAAYTGLVLLFPVPGIGAGVLEPGMDFGAWIDRMVLDGHMWARSKTWDPEGLVSTLPAVCSMLAGVLTGRWLATGKPRQVQTLWMLAAGAVFIIAGMFLDTALMPVNKSLWSTSYVVLTTGYALLAFGGAYWLLDAQPSLMLRERTRLLARPFLIYGMNALFIFAFSGLAAKMLGFIKLQQDDGSELALGRVLYAPLRDLPVGAVNSSLLYAILFNAVMFAVAWAMWRKKWFVKV